MIGRRVEASIRQQVEVHPWTAAIAKSGAPEQHQMQKHLGALLFNTLFAPAKQRYAAATCLRARVE